MARIGRIGVLALLVVLGLRSAMAANYQVGGTGGWTLQSTNSVYDNQFNSIKLFVGDTLTFNFTAPTHNVYEIAPANLPSCDFSNPIAKYVNSNPVITLTTAGVHAFACEVPTHCSSGGMQLQVTVNAAAPGPAPVSPPTPAPVTAPTPAPAVKSPTPAPVAKSPTPAPAKTAPAPSPKSAAPKGSPTSPAGPSAVPSTANAPAPAPGTSAGSFVTSGPAMVVAAVVAGFAVLVL